MEWIPVVIVIGVGVLLFGGKKFAPKIMTSGKSGVDAWKDEISKVTKKAKLKESSDDAKQ